MGLVISFDEIDRIDIGNTQEIINLTGPNRVPVPKNMNSSSIIHGAMDYFDHEESTLSGIEGSHDTILVLFQKPDMVQIQEEISKKPENISKLLANKSSLSCILDCRTLIRRGKFCSRVEIPADFQPKLRPDMTQTLIDEKVIMKLGWHQGISATKLIKASILFSCKQFFSRYKYEKN